MGFLNKAKHALYEYRIQIVVMTVFVVALCVHVDPALAKTMTLDKLQREAERKARLAAKTTAGKTLEGPLGEEIKKAAQNLNPAGKWDYFRDLIKVSIPPLIGVVGANTSKSDTPAKIDTPIPVPIQKQGYVWWKHAQPLVSTLGGLVMTGNFVSGCMPAINQYFRDQENIRLTNNENEKLRLETETYLEREIYPYLINFENVPVGKFPQQENIPRMFLLNDEEENEFQLFLVLTCFFQKRYSEASSLVTSLFCKRFHAISPQKFLEQTYPELGPISTWPQDYKPGLKGGSGWEFPQILGKTPKPPLFNDLNKGVLATISGLTFRQMTLVFDLKQKLAASEGKNELLKTKLKTAEEQLEHFQEVERKEQKRVADRSRFRQQLGANVSTFLYENWFNMGITIAVIWFVGWLNGWWNSHGKLAEIYQKVLTSQNNAMTSVLGSLEKTGVSTKDFLGKIFKQLSQSTQELQTQCYKETAQVRKEGILEKQKLQSIIDARDKALQACFDDKFRYQKESYMEMEKLRQSTQGSNQSLIDYYSRQCQPQLEQAGLEAQQKCKYILYDASNRFFQEARFHLRNANAEESLIKLFDPIIPTTFEDNAFLGDFSGNLTTISEREKQNPFGQVYQEMNRRIQF